MDPEFKNARTLHGEGLLHKKLLIRMRILTSIALVLLAVGAFDAVRYGLHGFTCLLIASVAFVLGLTVFSRMNKVVWDEEAEIIAAGRMDMTGFAVLILYILFEVGVRSFLHAQYPGVVSVTGYILLAIGGSLLGRSIGTRIAVYKLARTQRESNNPNAS